MLLFLCLFNGFLAFSNAHMEEEPQPVQPQSSDYSTVDFMVEVIKPVEECQRGAKISDLLTVHYNGTFANGSKDHFDSR